MKKFVDVETYHRRRRQREEALVLAVIAVIGIIAGAVGMKAYSSQLLFQEIVQTRKLLEQSHCSVVVLSPEAAEALTIGAETDARLRSKDCSGCHRSLDVKRTVKVRTGMGVRK